MTEEGSGSYLYTAGNNCSTNPCYGMVASWSIPADGNPTQLSGPLNTGPSATNVDTANTAAVGIARKFGN
jgi:hypothetical protein